jgi:hypothetical protein
MPRCKYLDHRKKYFNYKRKRKKIRKDTTPRTRSLLKLLLKMNGLLDKLENELSENLQMPAKYYQQRTLVNYFQETGTNIEYQINGPYNSTLNFNSDGYLKVSGTFISVNEMSIFQKSRFPPI